MKPLPVRLAVTELPVLGQGEPLVLLQLSSGQLLPLCKQFSGVLSFQYKQVEIQPKEVIDFATCACVGQNLLALSLGAVVTVSRLDKQLKSEQLGELHFAKAKVELGRCKQSIHLAILSQDHLYLYQIGLTSLQLKRTFSASTVASDLRLVVGHDRCQCRAVAFSPTQWTAVMACQGRQTSGKLPVVDKIVKCERNSVVFRSGKEYDLETGRSRQRCGRRTVAVLSSAAAQFVISQSGYQNPTEYRLDVLVAELTVDALVRLVRTGLDMPEVKKGLATAKVSDVLLALRCSDQCLEEAIISQAKELKGKQQRHEEIEADEQQCLVALAVLRNRFRRDGKLGWLVEEGAGEGSCEWCGARGSRDAVCRACKLSVIRG